MSNASLQSLEASLLERIESAESVSSLEEEVLNLHDLFRLRLFRYAVSLGLKAHDAEDVIQEVFLALFRHLQIGRSRSNLPGWVFRVTHHLALKRRIQYRREDSVEESGWYNSASDLKPSPEEELIFGERQLRLRRTFEALPETDRLCVQLRAEGLKYREISNVLGISLGSVANSLGRSLSRLRRSDGGEPCGLANTCLK
jgi:RNA polymerase sigma-70 factor (ECF subfamily)